jgi:hypothetical protein
MLTKSIPNLTLQRNYLLSLFLGFSTVSTVCVTGRWAGVDSAWEQEKPEARKMLENGDESPPSSARGVSPHLIFMDMVHHHSLHQCRRRAL